jgi:lipid-A-disaccharide synthase
VVRHLPALHRLYRRVAGAVVRERPAALVLIDYPGFNLRLARVARRAGIPVVYFIPPQVWAWRPARIRAVRASVTRVLSILPFETALYEQAGVSAEFVGHPAVDAVAGAPTREQARRSLGIADGDLLIGLLPGSRHREIERMTPLMAAAAARLAAARPRARFALALAPTVERAAVARHLAAAPPVQVVAGRTHAVMRAADLVLATSGTATLECALLGTPMVVCYRVSRISELLGAVLLRVPWISLVNIVLGYGVVPELFHRRDATPEHLARAASRLLDTPGALQRQREAFQELAGMAGAPDVGARVARRVLQVAGLAPTAEAVAAPGSGR